MGVLDLAETASGAEMEGVDPDAVRRELHKIIISRHFRTSRRSQQFLEYVVEQKLLGNESSIKERVIGIQVFGRDVNYATGDDPCVRVQAGEVRRRLEAYRAELQEDAEVWIELPIGSYVPVLHRWTTSRAKAEQQTNHEETIAASTDAVSEPASLEQASPSSAAETFPEAPSPSPHPKLGIRPTIKQASAALVLLICGILVGHFFHWTPQATDAINRFWGPILVSHKPVVMSLGKPLVYTPSDDLFDKYDQKHPGTFDQLVDRHNRPLTLDSDATIKWSDMTPKDNSGPAIGGVRAGMALTSFLGRFGKPYSVRFGEEGAFVDFRDSPTIIVSNLNSHWTTSLENDFPFRIYTSKSEDYIEEPSTGHTWRMTYNANGMTDYGLITREPVGITGEFLLKVAGLGDGGSEAAAEVVTDPVLLQQAIGTLPPHWENKNLQILVGTEMIGRKASPPRIIGVHSW